MARDTLPGMAFDAVNDEALAVAVVDVAREAITEATG